jgi:hypothetical protein
VGVVEWWSGGVVECRRGILFNRARACSLAAKKTIRNDENDNEHGRGRLWEASPDTDTTS